MIAKKLSGPARKTLHCGWKIKGPVEGEGLGLIEMETTDGAP